MKILILTWAREPEVWRNAQATCSVAWSFSLLMSSSTATPTSTPSPFIEKSEKQTSSQYLVNYHLSLIINKYHQCTKFWTPWLSALIIPFLYSYSSSRHLDWVPIKLLGNVLHKVDNLNSIAVSVFVHWLSL